MKRIVLLCAVLSFSVALTGCNKDDDTNKFMFTSSGKYILQTEAGGKDFFSPYAWFTVPPGTMRIAGILKNDNQLAGTSFANYSYELSPLAYINMDPADPNYAANLAGINGEYTLYCENSRGDKLYESFEIDVSAQDVLGDMVVEEFYYAGDNVIKAKIKSVANAGVVGFRLRPLMNDLNTESRIFEEMWGVRNQYDNQPDQEIETKINWGGAGINSFTICPIAVRSLSNGVSIFLEGPRKTYIKGASSFEEDKGL